MDGHCKPCIMTGDNPASDLRGRNLLLLSLCRLAFPKASIAEVNCFMFNSTPQDQEQRFYSPAMISQAENLLGMSHKRGQMVPRQANTPENLAKRFTDFFAISPALRRLGWTV